jgi:NAD(P)-dependent dehydrogenase (short-subunit alcohol dehydrogenase family)
MDQRVAIVTGGGRGLGKATALRLARDGFAVALAGPNVPVLEAVAEEVQALGQGALPVVVDVAEEPQVRAMASRVLERWGRVDVLVNNAAVIGPTAPAVEVKRADWDRVLAVNLTGALLCCQAVLPGMLARRSGKIVNLSSIAGKMAYALRAPYAVSKWGLIGLTLTLAKEVGPSGVRVNAVCPGPVAGERMQRVIQQRAAEQKRSAAEVEQEYVAGTALGQMVRESDVADLVGFLASPAGDSMTGQVLDVTAGFGL